MSRKDLKFPEHLPELLCETLKSFWEKGVFDEYAEEHFLIRAINDDIKGITLALMKKDIAELRSRIYDKVALSAFVENFIINFSTKLTGLCNYFGEDKMEFFLREQFAAGKAQYNEDQFWQALSEIHMLCYFISAGPAFVKNVEYEPRLGIGESNPEARLVYEDSMILDIEVKTPRFPMRDISKEHILPLVLLDAGGRKLLVDFCRENQIECCLPRVLKIKDYINSAGKKFEVPKSEDHINLLAINWTYSEFADTGLSEPISLFCNPANGLFVNPSVWSALEIESDAMKKISAVLLYKVPDEMLMFGDARYLFLEGNSKLIVNPYAECVSEESVFNMIHLSTKWPEFDNFRFAYYDFAQESSEKKMREICEIFDEHILK